MKCSDCYTAAYSLNRSFWISLLVLIVSLVLATRDKGKHLTEN